MLEPEHLSDASTAAYSMLAILSRRVDKVQTALARLNRRRPP